jgi:hypothetical protein
MLTFKRKGSSSNSSLSPVVRNSSLDLINLKTTKKETGLPVYALNIKQVLDEDGNEKPVEEGKEEEVKPEGEVNPEDNQIAKAAIVWLEGKGQPEP